MIAIIDDLSKYKDLYNNDPFGCRIASLSNTYSSELPFVDYWVQLCDNEPVALIARLETTFIIRITDNADIAELSSFLRVSGAVSIICDGKYELDIVLNRIEGLILVKDTEFSFDEHISVVSPAAKEVYQVISSCTSENFNVPDYESFALDVGHKLNNNTIRILGIMFNNELCSCIMTLAESEDSAVLGALATLPSSRNCGYGSYLIKYISNALIKEGKSVYLHRAMNENIDFYNKLGFVKYGTWAEYIYKD